MNYDNGYYTRSNPSPNIRQAPQPSEPGFGVMRTEASFSSSGNDGSDGNGGCNII